MKKIIVLFAICFMVSGAKSQTIVTVPYHEDFETAQGAAKWDTTDLNFDDGNWFWADVTYGNLGYQQSYCFAYIYSYMNAANDWLVSPGLSLTGGVSYNISFKYAEFDSTKTEKLKVFIGNSTLPADFSDVVVDLDSFSSQTFNTFTYSYTPVTTGNYFVGFHAYSDVNQGAILIDEFDASSGSSLNEETSPLKDVTVFPNPTSDFVRINNASSSKITISDITGNILYSCNSNDSKIVINMRDYAKGIYVLNIEKDGYFKTQKLIVD
jgi:hypothetical protein